jgi:hypothetical protein
MKKTHSSYRQFLKKHEGMIKLLILILSLAFWVLKIVSLLILGFRSI